MRTFTLCLSAMQYFLLKLLAPVCFAIAGRLSTLGEAGAGFSWIQSALKISRLAFDLVGIFTNGW